MFVPTPPSLLRRALGMECVDIANLRIFFAVVLVAMIARILFVTEPLVDVFSWRQASTAMIADNIPANGWNIFYPEVGWTGPGPSYQGREFQLLTLIAAMLNTIFGWHDWFGRAVAVAFSLVTLVSLHRLAALVWDETPAHAVTLAYGLMPAAIMIDTSYLPDPVMLAGVTLGILLFLRYYLTGSTAMLVGASVAFGIGVLCKPPGLGAGLVVAWLVVLMVLNGEYRRAVYSVLAMIGVLAVIISYYRWATYIGNAYPPYHVAGEGYIWDVGLATFRKEAFYIDSLTSIATWWFYGVPFLVLFLAGLWFYPGRGRTALAYLPLVWALGAVAVYTAAAKEISNNPWNMHLASVPLAFLAGAGACALVQLGTELGQPIARSLRFGLILGWVVFFATVPLMGNMKNGHSESARQMGRAMERLKIGPDEIVIAVSPDVGDPIAIYYSRGRGWVFPPGGGDAVWSVFVDEQSEAIAQLQQMRDQGATLFGYSLAATDDQQRKFTEHHSEVIAWLDENASLAERTSRYVIYRLK